jgi:N6-adenosine-specific RNA methylase IME4
VPVDPFAGLPKHHFRVIYADPPWRFHAWSHRGEGKGASQHYPTMRLEDICALPVGELAADSAVLFLWVVQPQLPDALKVVEAWGFHFKTVAFVWVKMPRRWNPRQLSLVAQRPRLGLGYHTRSGAEQCWLAIRGKGYRRQAQGIEQVIHSPLREHSRKPDEVAQRIERLVGEVPRIELFARGPREGWLVWGKEA